MNVKASQEELEALKSEVKRMKESINDTYKISARQGYQTALYDIENVCNSLLETIDEGSNPVVVIEAIKIELLQLFQSNEIEHRKIEKIMEDKSKLVSFPYEKLKGRLLPEE